MTSILAANWKMNLPEEGVDNWVDDVLDWPASDAITIIVAPPFPFLARIAGRIGSRALGLAGQNVAEEESGAFTGEVSAPMLRQIGCTDVIVGHSERRQILGETDETVQRKLRRASGAGLRPILCIGETKKTRDAGRTIEHLDMQLKAALGPEKIDDLVIAYEPVWAIGTGDHATTAQVEEAHAAIDKIACDLGHDGTPILYGGSVKPDNAGDLAATPGVAGFLVGGASLVSGSFRAIRDAIERAV